MAKLGPGARVGDQFSLIRKIGEGGCGEVYLAEQTTLGRNAVVKLMHPELSRDPSYVARFRREAQLAAKLTHHHTAAIYAFGETPERVLWIAMEYIEGESLHNVLAKDTARQVADLLVPVGDVLDRAGVLGIIHRDVKPDNIIVSPDGGGRRAVLLDFGLARPMEDNDKLTAVGVAVGSPTYMSPEQVFGPVVDSATDRYALGIILYIAVAKRPPFRHDDRVQLVLMHKRQPVPALHSIVSSIPVGHPLDQFFTKALAKQPQDRHPSAREMVTEFVQALEEAQVSEVVSVSVPAAPIPTPPRPPAGPARGSVAPGTLGPRRAPPPTPSGGIGNRPTLASRMEPLVGGTKASGPRPTLSPAFTPRAVAPGRIQSPASADTPVDGTARQNSDPTLLAPKEDDSNDKDTEPGQKRLLMTLFGSDKRVDVLCASEATLGKHRDCDVVCRAFPTPEQDAITHGVSRQHAKLKVIGGKLMIEDLASLNGTFLDDKRLTGSPVPLYDEARVRLGPVLTLEVRLFRGGAALLRRVDPYHGDYPPTLLLWDKLALGEPALAMVPATGDSITRWGNLSKGREEGDLWWGGPVAVNWQRQGRQPSRPQALQPGDRLVLGVCVVEWQAGPKPGLG